MNTYLVRLPNYSIVPYHEIPSLSSVFLPYYRLLGYKES